MGPSSSPPRSPFTAHSSSESFFGPGRGLEFSTGGFRGFAVEGHLEVCKLDRQSIWRRGWGWKDDWGLHLACILRSDNWRG